MNSRLLIKGAALWSESGFTYDQDIVVSEGRIARIDRGIADAEARVVHARDWFVLPGFVDIHARLYDRGYDDEETIASGLNAAAWGGLTTVLLMPDVDPSIDRPADVQYVQNISDRSVGARALVCAPLTVKRQGQDLAELMNFKRVGAVAAGDAAPFTNANVLRNAFLYARMAELPVFTVAYDAHLSEGKVAHEGPVSFQLGLSGMPAASEWIALSRDLLLAESVGGHVHVHGISTRRSVELIRDAKRKGVNVTASCNFHHLILTDETLIDYDTSAKLLPPLRPAADVSALVEGVATGVIDAVATDHIPVGPEEKLVEFDYAPFGAAGFESMLPAVYTELVATEKLSWNAVVEAMSLKPRSVLKLERPTFAVGEPFEATLFDPSGSTTIDPTEWQSRAHNTPLAGRCFRGKVQGIYRNGQAFGHWREEVLQ